MNALYWSTCVRGHSVAEAWIIRNCCEIVARMYWKLMMSSRFHRNLLLSNIMHFMYKAHIYQPCNSITIKSVYVHIQIVVATTEMLSLLVTALNRVALA